MDDQSYVIALKVVCLRMSEWYCQRSKSCSFQFHIFAMDVWVLNNYPVVLICQKHNHPKRTRSSNILKTG